MVTKDLEKKLKISENTGIHCPTLELAKQVLSIFHQLGLKWCSETYYITCTHWDNHKENTVYHPFDGEFSSLEFAREIGCKVINAKEFITLHRREELKALLTEGEELIALLTEGEGFDLENYDPKGELEGFPKEIIARMLNYQEEQGNLRDVSVFEKTPQAGTAMGGFDWCLTEEKLSFWLQVIDIKDFDYFFDKYPKKKSKICEQCRSYNQESKRCDNYYANKSSVNLPEKQNLCCYFEDKNFDYAEKDDKKLLTIMTVIVILAILSIIILKEI